MSKICRTERAVPAGCPTDHSAAAPRQGNPRQQKHPDATGRARRVAEVSFETMPSKNVSVVVLVVGVVLLQFCNEYLLDNRQLLPTVNARPSVVVVPFLRGGNIKADDDVVKPEGNVLSSIGVLTFSEKNQASRQAVSDLESKLPTWLIETVEATSTGCCLLLGTDVGVDDDGDNDDQRNSLRTVLKISDLPKDEYMIESLSLLCDTVILLLPPVEADERKNVERILKACQRGAQLRCAALGRTPGMGLLKVYCSTASGVEFMERALESQRDLWGVVEVTAPAGGESSLSTSTYFDVVNTNAINLPSIVANDSGVPFFAKLLQSVYESKSQSSLRLHPFLLQKDLRGSGGTSNASGTSGTTRSRGHEEHEYEHVATAEDSEQHSPTTANNRSTDDMIQEALRSSRVRLEGLESTLQQVVLNDQEENPIPVLDFGDQANDILVCFLQDLSGIPRAMRLSFARPLVHEVQRLYHDHVQSLRDYYGKRYESALDSSNVESEWTQAAEHMTQGFRAAAQHAIPDLCLGDLSEIADNFDYVRALNGLCKDMMEATEQRNDEESRLALEADEDDEDGSGLKKRRRIPKFFKKLAARAVVFAVNYLQGWLAWQGVKHAALERDRNMPKFPLF